MIAIVKVSQIYFV